MSNAQREMIFQILSRGYGFEATLQKTPVKQKK